MSSVGRWRTADGREYRGTPEQVLASMRADAFGYTGPIATITAYAAWVVGRLGVAFPFDSSAPPGRVALFALRVMERRGLVVSCTAQVLPFVR